MESSLSSRSLQFSERRKPRIEAFRNICGQLAPVVKAKFGSSSSHILYAAGLFVGIVYVLQRYC